MGKRFSIRIMDGSISAERTSDGRGWTVAEKGSSLFFLLVLIPDILSVHPGKEGTAAAADVASADIIDK